MDPAPVGVEHDGSLLSGAATARRALLNREGRVGLRSVGANLLGVGDCEQGESGECKSAEHPGRVVTVEDFIVDVGRVLNS